MEHSTKKLLGIVALGTVLRGAGFRPASSERQPRSSNLAPGMVIQGACLRTGPLRAPVWESERQSGLPIGQWAVKGSAENYRSSGILCGSVRNAGSELHAPVGGTPRLRRVNALRIRRRGGG
jgi:hypothetical protein